VAAIANTAIIGMMTSRRIYRSIAGMNLNKVPVFDCYPASALARKFVAVMP
jgi:hypothetical protein